jgi:DNA-directed RNA polymerase specialized sigma subunit
MRRILVEIARQKASLKRGGDRDRMDVVDSLLAAPEPREDLVALDAALTKLAETDKQAAELVQLRYFAGLPIREIAEILGILRARPIACGRMPRPGCTRRSRAANCPDSWKAVA